jgi:DNA-binding transcriptional ArsR family regulator
MTYDAVIAALADPTRRAILEMLRDGPSAVGELAEHLPVSRAAVSQHLRVLKDANLVSETAAGTRHIYRAEPEGLEELRKYLQNFWGDILASYAAASDRPAPRKSKGKKKERTR